MTQIYESLKSLINQDMISKAAATLGEDNSKVASAVKSILPSLLGRLLKVGNTQKVKAIMEDAGANDCVNILDQTFSGHGIVENKNYGERLENALLGTQNRSFYSAIASKTGLKVESADRLTNWVAGAIAAYFGEKIVRKNNSFSGLLVELEKDKNKLREDIPSNVYSTLGLSTVLGGSGKNGSGKKKNGWLPWVIIIMVLLLFFLIWRSCNRRNNMNDRVATTTQQIENAAQRSADSIRNIANRTMDTIGDRANRMAADVKNAVEKTTLILPSGKRLTADKNGCEERMVAYLNSDEFKKASTADLQKKWFDFDRMDFKFNSTTELMDNSTAQLDNMVAILKEYKDVKVRVGGFADKRGTEGVNDEISQERADHVKAYMVKNGIDASRISTVAFGEDYAQYAASAPDNERRLDRHIAMRFDK